MLHVFTKVAYDWSWHRCPDDGLPDYQEDEGYRLRGSGGAANARALLC